jgi:hypothetical protein
VVAIGGAGAQIGPALRWSATGDDGVDVGERKFIKADYDYLNS